MTLAEPAVMAGERSSVVSKMWPPAPQSVGRARQLLAGCLHDWGLPHLADCAGLVLSELFTNAVTHAFPPYGQLISTRFVRLVCGGVRVEVHDPGEGRPEPREVCAEAESGRGLALVDALTGGRWGVGDREGPGKVVWAVCCDDVREVAG